MRVIFLFLIIIQSMLFGEENREHSIPPPNLPVKILTGFRLIRLISMNEKEQTFRANVYFDFKWSDPRLAFTPTTGEKAKIYMEDAAPEKLKEIWWPQIEYMNTSDPVFNNRTLFIFPDGRVEYYLGITGDFRFPADFRRFPFDSQKLIIQVDSFLWSDNICVFVPNSSHIDTPEEIDVNEVQKIVSIKESIEYVEEPELIPLGGSGKYSIYTVTITIQRNFLYFLHQVILPILLLLAMTFTIYFAADSKFLDKVYVAITCFLALIAIRFALAGDLPHIGYSTILDKIFLISYIAVTLITASLVLSHIQSKENPNTPLTKFLRISPWFVVFLYVIGALLIYWFS